MWAHNHSGDEGPLRAPVGVFPEANARGSYVLPYDHLPYPAGEFYFKLAPALSVKPKPDAWVCRVIFSPVFGKKLELELLQTHMT
jgi:hypothetical protein